MQYVLFFPKRRGPNNQHLHDVGLGSLCSQGGPDWEETRATKDRPHGMLCTWRTGNPAIDPPRGWPEQFEWTKHDDVWLGFNPDDPVQPQDVAHREMQPGLSVELADGNKWQIPNALTVDQTIGIDFDTGDHAIEIDEQFEAFCNTSFEHMAALIDKQDEIQRVANKTVPQVEVFFVDAISHALYALEVNYRLSSLIVNELKLLTLEHVKLICFAALGVEAVKESDDDQPLQVA